MKLIEYAPTVFTAEKEGRQEFFSPEGLIAADYLVLKVKNKSHHLQGLILGFWREASETVDLAVTFGLIPQIETTICFPLVHLDSQTMFLPRTAGTLKRVIFGNKIESKEVSRISLGFDPHIKAQSLEVKEIYFSNEIPEFIVPEMKIVDELGQCKLYDWEGKTHSKEELSTYLTQELEDLKGSCFPENWSAYGGDMSLQFEATGFFRTEFDEKKEQWFLVDPLGYGFYSIGLDCVGLQCDGKVDEFPQLFDKLEGTGLFSEAITENENHPHFEGTYYNFSIANMIRIFGEKWWESWAELTENRLKNWGFNTIGNWSDEKFCLSSKIPFVYPLKDFPTTEKLLFRDFPDVFSEEYEKNTNEFANQLEKFKDNPYFIGYFLRNEPLWAFVEGMSLAEEVLETSFSSDTKTALIAFLMEKYKEIEKLNVAWNIELKSFGELEKPLYKARQYSKNALADLDYFSGKMIEKYVALPSIACKKVDKNHLNLGMRYAYIWHEALLAGSEHFDVFSFNCYKMNPVESILSIGKMTNLPVMIGEFHFGAMDRGMMSTGLKGVSTQKDRGIAYRYYVEQSAAQKCCVGTHYFTLNDQAYLGRFDGENFQIGIVDCCHRVYEDFLQKVRDCHQQLYDVKKGKIQPTENQAEEIPRVGF